MQRQQCGHASMLEVRQYNHRHWGPVSLPPPQDRNGPNGSVIVTADYVRADSTWRPSKAFTCVSLRWRRTARS